MPTVAALTLTLCQSLPLLSSLLCLFAYVTYVKLLTDINAIIWENKSDGTYAKFYI